MAAGRTNAPLRLSQDAERAATNREHGNHCATEDLSSLLCCLELPSESEDTYRWMRRSPWIPSVSGLWERGALNDCIGFHRCAVM